MIERDDLDVGQLPDAWTYDRVDPDTEVTVKTKSGFTLGSDGAIYFGTLWRMVPDGIYMIVENKETGTWTEVARFEV